MESTTKGSKLLLNGEGYLMLSILVIILIFFAVRPGIKRFNEAFRIGQDCAQDNFCSYGEYTEAGFKYWEAEDWWIEQGYEEGWKAGIRNL